MARRHPIDPDELFETANRLAAEGKDVTATMLLDELGGGSLRTIYKYLDQWKNSAPVAPVKRSVEIPDRVQAGFAMAWRLANDEAAIEIEAAKAKAAQEVASVNARFQEALTAAEKLEQEAQENSDLIDTLRAQVAALTQEVSSLNSQCASYKATAEQLAEQVRAQEQELERIHKAKAEEREEHATQIAKLESAAAQASRSHENQMSSIRKTVEDIQTRVVELEKQRDEARSGVIEIQKQLERVEAAAKVDREERDAAIKEAAELKGLSGSLKEQNLMLLAKLNADDKADKKR